MAEQHKFYMSRFIQNTNSWEQEIELTEHFQGLIFCECKGVSDYGAIKNIYSETFAESDTLRVYLPEKAVRESTDIKLTVLFTKENRRDVYDSFVEYITGKRIKYWDTVRNRQVEMIQVDKIEIDEDLLYGSAPYIAVEFPFKNLKGYTEKKV